MMDKEDLRLYFICGSTNVEGDALKVIEEALGNGVTMFQLREKGEGALTGRALLEFGRDIKALCRKYSVPLIINDDVPLALELEADGIHLGQDDDDIGSLPAYFEDRIVGLSVRDEAELSRNSLENVDYIGTGPVFTTSSKDDAGDDIGPSGLREMRRLIGDLPMVAIGGITHENYHSCLEAGADGVSVISSISEADDVSSAVKKFFGLSQ